MHNISLEQFKSLFPDAPSVGLGEDFYIIDVTLSEKNRPLGHPCRFDGFMIIYCISGHIKLNVNLEEHELKENMLFFNYPGNIIRVNELVNTRKEDMHCVCVLMSKEFVSGLMLDVNKIFTKNMEMMRIPGITLTQSEQDLLSEHIKLIIGITSSGIIHKEEAVRSILSSIFYMMADVWASRMAAQETVSPVVSSRSRLVFEQFIKLVTEYHTTYRNVGFYADRLCLTPKYLSRIIKDATGRSAPEWIDSYVILEAKNLLKYSGHTIKEIVYRLNFPNQSVFYKFFKARTGMTPTEYRNS